MKKDEIKVSALKYSVTTVVTTGKFKGTETVYNITRKRLTKSKNYIT